MSEYVTQEEYRKDVVELREKVVACLGPHLVESINAVGLALMQSSYDDMHKNNQKILLKIVTEWALKES